ncbi:ion channel [Knoellia sp. 3-2P3]|uniref:ion channel n=1 Tax=unclassified Knoellia TaxID=2618719 RepID=UPI0023DBFA58|nr:ion channel [Knoellia sp. 3-2P3]MDF2092808.1 ion channel [Knoellia sp. 3-2P3]
MSQWMTTVKAHPSGVLLAAQLIAVLAYPFTGETPVGRAVLGVFGLFVLAVAVWAVRATPALTWIAITLGIPVMVLTVAEAVYPGSEVIRLWSSILHALFYGYTAYGLVRYLFDDTFVTRDEVFAVGANFTVVAWGFAYAFMAVQVVWPNSFVSFQGEGFQGFPNLLFLSFATLTSVGLSDVIPVLPHARSVAMVEQVAGVLYVAMIISRVVSLTVLKRR